MVLDSSTECTALIESITVSKLTLCTNKGSIIPLIAVIKWFISSTWNRVLIWDLLNSKSGGVQWSILLTKDPSDNPISNVQPWYGPLRFKVQMEISQERLHFTSVQLCSAWQAGLIGMSPRTVGASLFCKSPLLPYAKLVFKTPRLWHSEASFPDPSKTTASTQHSGSSRQPGSHITWLCQQEKTPCKMLQQHTADSEGPPFI